MGMYRHLKERALTLPYVIVFLVVLIVIFYPKDTVNKNCVGLTVLRSVTESEEEFVINATCFGIPY